MSFFHSTIVGHFDPCTLNAFDRKVTRPLDIQAATTLLTEYPDHVASQIEFRDGYAECWWADGAKLVSEAVHRYAYRLAELQNCVAAETPVCVIMYPEDTKQLQAEAWLRWRDQNPPKKQEALPPPLFNPRTSVPCPFCGEPLRTSMALQCRFCKMDWHDPKNIYRRVTSRG